MKAATEERAALELAMKLLAYVDIEQGQAQLSRMLAYQRRWDGD